MHPGKSIDIKEITSAWWDSYFADDNQKELAKESKQRAKERGEKNPTEGTKSSPEYAEGASTSPISGKK